MIGVLRLTGVPELEGVWREFHPGGYAVSKRSDGWVTFVATGSVEWDGDRPAMVFVPEDRLVEWRAEFDEP